MKTFTLIFSLVSALCVLALAQAEAPRSIALSADEQREAAAARQAVEQAGADRGKAWQIIQQTPVTDCARATAAVAVAQQVEQRVATAEAQRDGMLWKHRAANGCADCDYSPDGKSLVRLKE